MNPPGRLARISPAVALAASFLASAGAATAAVVTVTPTTVVLSPSRTTELLSLENQGTAPTRFQLAVASWDQSPEGETLLEESSDIAFFPPLLSVEAGASVRVRLATTRPADTGERAYRLILQELPPLAPPGGGGAEVSVLTRISLPIFVQPRGAQRIDARVEPRPVEAGMLTFSVRNTGTQRLILRRAVVTGETAAGARTFEASAPGWYVLAGGRRDYMVELGAADCTGSQRLKIEAELDEQRFAATLPLPPGACAARAPRATRFVEAAPSEAAAAPSPAR